MRRFRVSLLPLLAPAAVVGAAAAGAPAPAAPACDQAPLRIAVYGGDGAILGDPSYPYIPVLTKAAAGVSCAATLEVLNDTEAVQSRLTNAAFDMVYFPGGESSRQAKGLGEAGLTVVRTFVEDGGGYIGTCGGAFLGLTWLDFYGRGPEGRGIPADSLGEGNVRVAFDKELMRRDFPELDLSGFEDPVDIHYEGGPVTPAWATVFPKGVEILAKYAADVPSSWGKKEGQGTPAISYAAYGKGRVVLNSPHPEHVLSEKGVGVAVYRGEIAWAVRRGRAGAAEGERVARLYV